MACVGRRSHAVCGSRGRLQAFGGKRGSSFTRYSLVAYVDRRL